MSEFIDEQNGNERETLKNKILETGKAAFDPANSTTIRATALAEFETTIHNASAWSLLPILNAAIQPGAVPTYLRPPLLHTLTHLPLRPSGVRSTLEFIFAVHPGSQVTAEESAQPQKLGANITTEALAAATRLLSSVPAGDDATEWFVGLRGELMGLFDGGAGGELAKVAGHVISFGILGRKAYGAPGRPGWRVFVGPLLKAIRPSTESAIEEKEEEEKKKKKKKKEEENVVDLRQEKVLSSYEDIALAIHRLSVLLHSSPSPGLCKRVVSHILLELWAIASAPGGDDGSEFATKCSKPARKLLATFIRVASSKDVVSKLIANLLYNGEAGSLTCPWEYRIDKSIEAVSCSRRNDCLDMLNMDWDSAGKKANHLATLVVNSCTDDEISVIFLELFRKWLHSKDTCSTPTPKPQITIIKQEDDQKDPDTLFKGLFEVMVLQGLMERASEKLISKSSQLLDLVKQVLEADTSQPQGEEVISVALSLFNQIVTAPNFQTLSLAPDTMTSLRESLDRLSTNDDSSSAQTARNLSMLLQYRDDLEDPKERTPTTDQQIEDRKAYSLARSYITEADSPPPVKSEGLNIISKLLVENSPVLDIPGILVLLSKIISDAEDFLNLGAVKMFTLVSEKHPKTVCRELLDHYLDAKERATTDTRLRFGEALLQVMQRLGQMFTGETATEISETLLSIASRRGYRKRTEQRQARQEKKRQMKNKEAEEAWGGEVLDMSDDIPEEERLNNEILAQIVQGWESKRGSEDVRIRASALSLFATAMETNVAAIGATLVEAAVDLCLNVLAYETEMEKGILRRAAIVVVGAFVTALDGARRERKTLGFGLSEESREDILRALRYIEVTDNDGLVRHHAKDVIENLKNWQMISLISRVKSEEEAGGFGGLAGIAGNPIEMALKANQGGMVNGRPRIEEIE